MSTQRPWAVRLCQAALELLYPSRCAACDAPVAAHEDPFCRPCELSLLPIENACTRCGRPLPPTKGPVPCLACLARPPRITSTRAPFEFGGALAIAIRRLKWHHLPELAPPLGALLEPALGRMPPAGEAIDSIVPVPLHHARLREREFNQATLLARGLLKAARARDHPLGRAPLDAGALLRTRDTPPQTGLDARARRQNVLGAFAVRTPARVHGRHLLLIDDVMTTGATVEACATALWAAGAATVHVLTLGRAVP